MSNTRDELVNRFVAFSGAGKVQSAIGTAQPNADIDTRDKCTITSEEVITRRDIRDCRNQDLADSQVITRLARFTLNYAEITPQLYARWFAWFAGGAAAPTGTPTNEQQTLARVGTVSGGGFKLRLTLEGRTVTTKTIAWNATAAQIEAALTTARMLFLHPGDVSVTGAWAGGTQNEQQKIAIAGAITGGDYTLEFDSEVTAIIPWNATASDIREALEGLANIDAGDVAVTGVWPNFTVEFKGQYLGTDVPLLVAVSSLTPSPADLTGPGVTIGTTTPGSISTNEVQSLVIDETEVGGGVYTLTYDTQETGPISWDAVAGDIQTALEGLSNIDPGDVAVTGAWPNFSVEFEGALALTDVTQLTADVTALEAIPIRLTEEVAGASGIAQINVEFLQRLGRADLPLLEVIDSTVTGGGSVSVGAGTDGDQNYHAFTRATSKVKQRFSFLLGYEDITGTLEKYADFVCESFQPQSSLSADPSLTVTILGPWDYDSLEPGYTVPDCVNPDALRTEDCKLEVNGAFQTSDLNSLTNNFNDNVPVDRLSAFAYDGPDVQTLIRGKQPTYTSSASVFGISDAAVYILAKNERTQAPVEVIQHFGLPGNRFTLTYPKAKIRFQNNREAFVGAAETAAVNLEFVPFADGADAPIAGEAYLDQTAQFLVASS